MSARTAPSFDRFPFGNAGVAAPAIVERGQRVTFGAYDDTDRAELARMTLEARIALEEAVVAAAVAAQRAIDVAAALDETLAVLSAAEKEADIGTTLSVAPGADIATLSPREREVLALVAEGRSNKAIAEALFVSPNTVKTHVASLLSKLNAASRAHLAALATRRDELAAAQPMAR